MRLAQLARAAAAACLLVAAAARAESLYVVEQVVVALNSSADGGERVATVKSGERVEVLERARDQVHVRLASGRDGWLRGSYLSADEPLRSQLAASAAELARLRQELGTARGELEAARSAAAATPPAGSAGAPATAPPAAAEEAASAPAGAMFATAEAPRRLWPWALAGAALALAVGFALGVAVLDRHIRRKYGGLRIY